jgi:hypothetical protein
MKTTTKKQSKRHVGEIIHYNAIAYRSGQMIAAIERDESDVELVEFLLPIRLPASHGGGRAAIWDCRVRGGSMDGAMWAFAIYEPSDHSW